MPDARRRVGDRDARRQVVGDDDVGGLRRAGVRHRQRVGEGRVQRDRIDRVRLGQAQVDALARRHDHRADRVAVVGNHRSPASSWSPTAVVKSVPVAVVRNETVAWTDAPAASVPSAHDRPPEPSDAGALRRR